MNTQEVLDPKSWAERTFGGIQLHDLRRTRRAVQAASKLAENPLGSLPAQMRTWKETKALYRLLDEPDVTFTALMEPHLQQSRDQAHGSGVVLLVQDTTDIDLSHRHMISFVQTNWQRTRTGIFRANGAGGASWDPRGARVPGEGHPLCAFPLPMENNALNGASGTSAKLMSGCAKCLPLGRLSREACGCMSATGARTCFRSFKPVRRPRRTFWCERGSHGASRKARKRSSIR